MVEKIVIKEEYMTLSQLLKWVGAVQSGGEVKTFLQHVDVTVNDEPESRRGKKLFDDDIIWIDGIGVFHITK